MARVRSIVSNAKRLETIVPLTEDREKLLAGLERLRNDPSQWDSYSDGEKTRAQEVIDVFTHTRHPRCPPLIAKAYARDEFLIARRSTERLAIAVRALAEAPAPKAIVYFGDTLRQSAGLHYLQVVRCTLGTRPSKRLHQWRRKLGRCAKPVDTFLKSRWPRWSRPRQPNSMR